jgi:DNA-binding CsgD family transcriptional regulator
MGVNAQLPDRVRRGIRLYPALPSKRGNASGMKHSARIAHFRQLCCLGLDSQTLMPSLLRALHELIGSHANSFYWAERDGDIRNIYMEQLPPQDIAELYFSEFVNNRARAYSAVDIRKYLPAGSVVGNSMRVFPKTFYNSDMYNLIWRPQRRQQLLWARVLDAQARANGIALTRVVGDRLFTQADEALLGQLVPYLAHALNAPARAPAQLIAHGESATVVLDQHGAVQYESNDARRLLLLAAHARVAPGTVDWRSHSVMPLALQQLQHGLHALQSGGAAAPPVLEMQNVWGKFTLKAYPMSAASGDRSTVVLIERQVPLQVKLMQAMRAAPLSPKQQQVCLLLAEGANYRAIAERLGVRPSTVIDHVRKIYDKFDVRSQHELLSKLMQNAAGSR